MSSILVVTWDAGGNVAPALGIAVELRARGHEVLALWATDQPQLAQVSSSWHAIQSAHCARRDGQPTNYVTLRKLYSALITVAPTLGAHISLAATIAPVSALRRP